MEKTLKWVCGCDIHKDERVSLILTCHILDMGEDEKKGSSETYPFGRSANPSGWTVHHPHTRGVLSTESVSLFPFPKVYTPFHGLCCELPWAHSECMRTAAGLYARSGPWFAKAEFSLDEGVWAAESLVEVLKQAYLVIAFDLCWEK